MKELGNLKKLEFIETLDSIIRDNMFDISTYNMDRKLLFLRNMLVHEVNLNERDISILESIVEIYKQCTDHPEKKKELRRQFLFYINLLWQIRNRRIVDSEYNTEDYYKKTIS